ncbi:cellulose binding domain-containing protein [Catellatospora bangladeshensis]|uniref:cellulose binding domain-containing protein n=1 Tax=Catellatospora bangladeshensis TaxID=310355 RepID=UPI0036189E64
MVTTGGSGGTCRVGWVPNTWGNGFTANVTIYNLGTTTINGWTLTWTFSGNQQVTSAWNATVTQSGAAVTARDVGWNGTIAPNGNAQFGFQGTYSGTNSTPTLFTLNNTPCVVS